MTDHWLLEELHSARVARRFRPSRRGDPGVGVRPHLAAIALGVAKITANTEVRRAYIHALRGSLTASDGDDLTRHLGAARAAASQVARSKIHSLQPRTDVEKPRLPDESES
jgi:hypothetical protein